MNELKRIDPKKNRGGVWIRFGDEEYRVPALGFGAVVDLQDKVAVFKTVGLNPTPEQAAITTEIVWRALRRNYPDLTQEDVADMIDISNFAEILAAVLNVSGFEKVKEGDSPGEALASTGTVSTSS